MKSSGRNHALGSDSLYGENNMNRQYIEDNHIVDRYLLGQLSEQKLCEFEAYYFEHPQMLEELTIAKAMHESLCEESERLNLVKAVEAVKAVKAIKKAKTKINWFLWLFQPKLGFAFSAILTVGVATLLLENSRLKSVESFVFPATSLTLSQTRGTNNKIDLFNIPKDQSAVSIRLITGPIGYPEVGLQLKDSSDNLLWQGKSKIDGPVGTVNLVIMTRQLTSGNYALSVFPPTDTSEALSIHIFKIERF